MQLKQDFHVGDLHYQVRFSEQQFEFALLNPPRRYLPHRADSWLMFWGEDHYEDVDFNAPIFKILQHVVGIIRAWVMRYNIAYFEFTAATARKQQVYERLLRRYLPENYAYQSVGPTFYVYRVLG